MEISNKFHEDDAVKGNIILLSCLEFIIKYLTVSISMLLTVEKPADDTSAEGK